MKKLIIYSGSFNPVTIAHYEVLSHAIEELHADKGIFMETNDDYLTRKIYVKTSAEKAFLLSEKVRASMLHSLNKENPKMDYGCVELGGASPSTERTIRSIMRSKDYKTGYEFYYLCGADKLRSIPRWTDVDRLIEEIRLVIFPRNDIDLDKVIADSSFLTEHKDRIIILSPVESIANVSSTKLRQLFFEGKSYAHLMNKGPYEILSSSFSPSDFKPVTDEDVIQATIRFDGRYGANNGRKMVYKVNHELFENWDSSRFGDRHHLIYDTIGYTSAFDVNNIPTLPDSTITECVNEDCVDTAARLLNNGYNPCILNLASDHHPCGGYADGYNAQEESLCYMSTLSQSLYQFGDLKYKCNRIGSLRHVDGIYPMDLNYGGVYTPGVTFFRNNIDKFYSLREHPFVCPVVSVASLSNGGKKEFAADQNRYFNSDGTMTDEGRTIEANKIRTIFRIALIHGHDSIVISPFGCGVYCLLPNEVAALFDEVLHEVEFENKFKLVSFSAMEKKKRGVVIGPEGKFSAFYQHFSR